MTKESCLAELSGFETCVSLQRRVGTVNTVLDGPGMRSCTLSRKGDEFLKFRVEVTEMCIRHEEMRAHTSEWKGLFLSCSPFLLASFVFPNLLSATTDTYFFFLVSAFHFCLTLSPSLRFLAFSFPFSPLSSSPCDSTALHYLSFTK